MSLNELMPSVRELPRADKARLAQFLIAELANETSLSKTDPAFPVWTPYNSFEAAQSLFQALDEDKAKR